LLGVAIGVAVSGVLNKRITGRCDALSIDEVLLDVGLWVTNWCGLDECRASHGAFTINVVLLGVNIRVTVILSLSEC